MDFTRGTVWKQILRFAFPLLIASLIQQMYSSVDLFFVGNYLGTNEMAAVGSCALVIDCMTGFFAGLSVGSCVTAAKYLGAGSREKFFRCVSNSMALSLWGGILLLLLGLFFAPLCLELIRIPEEIFALAKNYITIYFFSFPMLLCFNMLTGIIRAGGNSLIPMLIQLMGGLIKIILNVLFLLLGEMGITGVALGTFLSYLVTAGISVVCLKRTYKGISVKPQLDRALAGEILNVGLPAGIQSVIITASNLVIQTQINSLGVEAISAFSIYIKAEEPVFYLITALGQALTAFVGQNAGAGRYSRIKKGTRTCLIIGCLTSGMISLLILALGKQVFGFFTDEQKVIALGCEILAVTFPFYFLYAVVDIPASALRGMEYAKVPMLLTLLNFSIVRLGLMFLFEAGLGGIQGIAWCYPGSWLPAALCMILCYQKYIRKQKWHNPENLPC